MVLISKLSRNQQGVINALLIPLILMTILFLSVSGFAIWAFTSRQEYKNNTDGIVAKQVEIAKKETATQKDNEFIEKEKNPLKQYQGPASFGRVSVEFPKTWSAYVDDTGKGSFSLDGYFNPVTVPGVQSGSSYALRLQVVNKEFSEEARSYDSQIKSGKARSSAYSAKKVPGVVGIKIEGEISSKQQGIVILLPIRDKTIKIFTESDQFYNDFNNIILPNLSFTP